MHNKIRKKTLFTSLFTLLFLMLFVPESLAEKMSEILPAGWTDQLCLQAQASDTITLRVCN